MEIYSAWGIKIASELPLPELTTANGPPDVTITIREGPPKLEDPGHGIVNCRSLPGEFHMRVRNTAEYYVIRGSKVTIVPLKEYNENETRLFLLGSGFGALLQQRGFLTLHGSCVEIGGQGVIFTGMSGAGKSTLAAAFYQGGHRIINDDVCAIKVGQECFPVVFPGFPSLKLWKDAAEKLGRETDGLFPLLHGYDKYRLNAELNYSGQPIRLGKIFILNTHESPGISSKEIMGLPKLEALLTNTYRYTFLKGQDLESSHFRQCVSVANDVRVYNIFRPESLFMIDRLMETITEICRVDKL